MVGASHRTSVDHPNHTVENEVLNLVLQHDLKLFLVDISVRLRIQSPNQIYL